MQIDGEIRLLRANEGQVFDEVYLAKFPEKRKKSQDPKIVAFTLIPTWWRFTDWMQSTGKVILTSDENK